MREDHVYKVIQHWFAETDDIVRDCFESVGWSIFGEYVANMN